MAGPLTGTVRVLDLSERSPSAAIAGMVLADLGAEVIRVEPEGETRFARSLARVSGCAGKRASS
jgi:crotonobetainyl-CoA:carnitine CoA-transferase CaiB-like acyl-CoA transferase